MDIKNKKNSPKKQVMRKSTRSCSRRAKTQDCVANVDEAKREFSLALHLHKSSSLSTGTNFDHSHDYDQNNYFDKPSYYKVYSLMEPMPLPEPIWSTTQPSVLASNNSSSDYSKDSLDLEFLEFVRDDQEDQTSWWVGFLKSLDGKITSSNVIEECCYKKHPIKEYFGCESEEETTNIVTPCVVDILSASDNKSLSGTTDEWLSFPSTPEDEDHETTISVSP